MIDLDERQISSEMLVQLIRATPAGFQRIFLRRCFASCLLDLGTSNAGGGWNPQERPSGLEDLYRSPSSFPYFLSAKLPAVCPRPRR
jgi:hypothetical protein